jgi:hypothetical protein
MDCALLELAYLPNIQWFRNYLHYDKILIERHENFIKSTARNRCEIAGANGKQILSIPLDGGRDHHQKYSDTRIYETSNWQSNHWQTICSAYGSAPFFEFYIDKLAPFYQTKHVLLFDFNLTLLQALLRILKISKPFEFTTAYEVVPTDKFDLRAKKKMPTKDSNQPYYQVFGQRHGFIGNLSLLDLIFNVGPEAPDYLTQ